jgi:NADP-dependent 3-hydroxy acid dehydrogenase YdfG
MSKVWFVTGAGSGIGAATARAALKAGDRVVATGRHLDKVRNALSDIAGDSLALVQLDVTNQAQAKAAVDAAIKAYGRIDVLVNNAGYSLPWSSLSLAAAFHTLWERDRHVENVLGQPSLARVTG